MTSKKILLTGVFGPFGVDDAYGRKENIMELFHNQVTKAQGPASFRFHHRSFGLYFMASNVNADITVLDFPSQKRFIREISSNRYHAIGISFITPNFVKARQMASLIRRHSPSSEIILGGHGAAILGIEDQIECDHVVRGEGIAWLRRYVGQSVDDPIVHPALPSTEMQRIFGIPVPGPTANLLITGVGCVNGCNFCSTSHFFGKKYTSFIDSGKVLFDTCCKIADERGTDTFFVMDENFLKNPNRAHELIEQMERHQRFFMFHLFSSTETITQFGVENMVRLGVQFVWVGFESITNQDAYEKNCGIDGNQLVKTLRDHGISVLASGILCMEHHTPRNIDIDINFMIDLKADAVQFMLFTPLPVTALYKRMKRIGVLKEDLPYEEWHGQKMLNWQHPAFQGNSAERLLNDAFKREYQANSSTIYRVIETSYRGLQTLSARVNPSANWRQRTGQLQRRLTEYATMLPVIEAHPANRLERQRAKNLEKRIREVLGPLSLGERLRRMAALAISRVYDLHLKLRGDRIQPATIVTRYRYSASLKKQITVPQQQDITNNTASDLRHIAARTIEDPV